MPKHNFIFLLISLLLAPLILTACQGKSTTAIQIEGAWGRPSPMETNLGAIYMKIRNTSDKDDKLTSASSPACGVIEMHETIMEGDMMGMRPVPEGYILIPANGTVELKTGGFHLMCIDKKQDFSVGAKIPLKLQFQEAGELELQVEVKNP